MTTVVDITPEEIHQLGLNEVERITELASRLVWMTADGEAPRFKGQ